ncbi:MAG: ABC transporter ATP-binding protein [Chitinophagaceae bacterium]|nr:MAG: ABC transporter ATP-binding protein [Chitinophagaceae bacterium]
MHYLSVENLSKSYGIKPLFQNITFNLEEGEKVALVAQNGTGKSSLLKIIAGKDTPDEGTLWIHKDVQVAYLAQEPQFDDGSSVLTNIFMHPHPVLQLIRQYEQLASSKNADSREMAKIIALMDDTDAWQFEGKVKEILGRLNITFLDQTVRSLSGGQRKRVALAKTLIDAGFDNTHILLLMDEPTNHLDMDMIEWLEQYLSKAKMTLLLVTHDRYFLDRVCNEIIELDEGQLYIHRGNYQYYVEKKYERKVSEKASVEKARNLLRKELDWMRRQPQARTGKSKSRIDAFYDLKDKASVRDENTQLSLNVKMSRLGGKILEMKKVYKSYGEKCILKGFDYSFKKGERIGIIGSNGAGKSTLLNILQGIEKPDSGKINIGDTVIFGYYHQQGLVFKEDKRLIEWVKDIAENFPLADGGVLSASEFLTRFLFPPEAQYTYISSLSGGEKKRLLLLSILFKNPNFLVLDEPTNDLDIQTLQVLEDFLESFPGCIMIVSHDRYFMDRLIDHLLVFEGGGRISDFPGNYSQYRSAEKEKEEKISTSKQIPANNNPHISSSAEKKKLSYSEKRELASLDKEIAQLELEKQQLEELINTGNADYTVLQSSAVRIHEITVLLDEKELRWLELDEKR